MGIGKRQRLARHNRPRGTWSRSQGHSPIAGTGATNLRHLQNMDQIAMGLFKVLWNAQRYANTDDYLYKYQAHGDQ